ncbi:Translation initiation factor IF-2, mitochondrial, partial [Dufourea novaeangliae]
VFTQTPKQKNILPVVEVWTDMTVGELAASAKRDVNDIVSVLDIRVTTVCEPTTVLSNFTVIHDIVKKLGSVVKRVAKPDTVKVKPVTYVDLTKSPPPDESVLVKRHPVVTIMGHVDHGKTTLLDSLRHTSVVDTEFGGITQHIGAFDVTLKSGERVTFLDTPGHAAFSSMRYRGAHVTDIVVLVVAADDGVKEQTLQSIEMARDANVPIIVAINKIDKPNADIKRTQTMLAENGIVVEDLGGDVQSINISALKGTNLEDLTSAIALQAEIMNLKGDPVGLVESVAIECTNHIGRGKLVTALIKRGTLKKGCLLVSGLAWAKVRAMFNEIGQPVLEAKPSEAVQIIGWRELPNVGDEILQVENEKILQMVLKYRNAERNVSLAQEQQKGADVKYAEHLAQYKAILDLKKQFGRLHPVVKSKMMQPTTDTKKTTVPAVNLVIKGDVAGSVEAILDILDTYKEDNLCKLNVVHHNVGNINETDLELADIFHGIVCGFNVDIPSKLKEEADEKQISVRQYRVIYKFVDDVKNEINRQLPEIDVEEVLGEASVQQQFQITEGKKKVNVAGSRCVKGVLQKSALYKLVRGKEVIYRGKLVSMRHLKDEVTEIKVNIECGLTLDNPTVSFKPGDTLVCFKLVSTTQSISWDPGF